MDKRVIAAFGWCVLAFAGAALITVVTGRAWMLASYPNDALVFVGLAGVMVGCCLLFVWLYFVGTRIAAALRAFEVKR